MLFLHFIVIYNWLEMDEVATLPVTTISTINDKNEKTFLEMLTKFFHLLKNKN